MVTYKGKGVCGAAAIGKVSVYRRREINIRRESNADAEKELERLNEAKAQALVQLKEIYDRTVVTAGEENAAVFEIHMMMAEDEDYNDAIIEMIRSEQVNAEYAVAVTGDSFAEMFSSMDDPYMQARSADVRDISNRLVSCLTKSSVGEMHLESPVIICADDLAPSETVTLDKEKVLAFVTAYGSSNSHTAILARGMNIPAITGLGEEFLSRIKDGDTAIADGFTGEFIHVPDAVALEKAEKKIADEKNKAELLGKLKGKDNVTADGKRIDIFANIGNADSTAEVLLNDAGGIGLFRSEFLYLENSDYPSEEEQFEVYRRVLESMGEKKVIIRTLDIGADKQCGYFKLEKEENPALGLRAVRICLERPEIFRTQLRALFRASAYGRLGIMFPMIASVWELEEVLSICRDVKSELKKEGVAYSEETELGIMIETPAAAIISDMLASMVDFFSVGTNDLTQYTLACDRQNPKLERYCDVHHEAVMRLIATAAENAHRYGKWIGICGELAADTSLTERFLRMGIDELSVSPASVLKVREKVRGINLYNA